MHCLHHDVTETPERIGRGFDAVLAVDTWHRWGAAYCLTVFGDGTWSSDIYLEERNDRGGWSSLITGGAHGTGWDASWQPTVTAPSLLLSGDCAGCCVDDDDNQATMDLVARGGFAAATVSAVLVDIDGEARTVAVWPRLNAFVVLGSARSDWSLTALGPDGERLAPPLVVGAD